MILYLYVDANLDDHPRHIAAGFWGSTIAQAAWRAAKRFGCHDGEITKFWTPEYLKGFVHYAGELDTIRNAMQDAERAGLVERREQLAFIHDWEQYQRRPRKTADERRETWRNQKRVQRAGGQGRTYEDNDGQGRTCPPMSAVHPIGIRSGSGSGGEEKPRDPTTTSATSIPECLLGVVARQQALNAEHHGHKVHANKHHWGKKYAELYLDSLPPGAPLPSEAEWQQYSERVLAALEHAYSEDCRTWSDGSPYRNHVKSPAQLFRCVDELLDDLDSSSADDDEPFRAPTDPIPGETYAAYCARIRSMG